MSRRSGVQLRLVNRSAIALPTVAGQTGTKWKARRVLGKRWRDCNVNPLANGRRSERLLNLLLVQFVHELLQIFFRLLATRVPIFRPAVFTTGSEHKTAFVLRCVDAGGGVFVKSRVTRPFSLSAYLGRFNRYTRRLRIHFRKTKMHLSIGWSTRLPCSHHQIIFSSHNRRVLSEQPDALLAQRILHRGTADRVNLKDWVLPGSDCRAPDKDRNRRDRPERPIDHGKSPAHSAISL